MLCFLCFLVNEILLFTKKKKKKSWIERVEDNIFNQPSNDELGDIPIYH